MYISKSQVDLAEKALKKAKLTGMRSRLFWDLDIGLKTDKIQDYATIVIQDLKVMGDSEAVDKVTSAFDKLELVTEKGGVVSSHVEELKFDVEKENELKCIYGFIAAIRTGDTFSVAYAHSCKKRSH